MEKEECGREIIRGKQRKAVYHALSTPRTGRQILEIARKNAPSMTYQDLRHILRNFQAKGLVHCLNPECQTGRFYLRTTEAKSHREDIRLIALAARVCRAKTRLAVLAEIGRDRYFSNHPLTATQIRKHLRETYPMGLNHVITALEFLFKHQLIEVAGRTSKRHLKIFGVTHRGRSILKLALTNSTQQISEATPTRLPV